MQFPGRIKNMKVPFSLKNIYEIKLVTFNTELCEILFISNQILTTQVYRLSAVNCQVTWYSQRVPGYVTRYSCVSNEFSVDKKSAIQIVSLNSCEGRKKLILPLHFSDFNKLFESMKWYQSGP